MTETTPKIYRVGGAVRDALLHYPSHETDYVVVGATPEYMLLQGYVPVGKSFPVFLHPKTKEEYALARSERKIAKGYHGFEFYTDPTVTLEEDLIRRDLTINAMAMDDDKTVIDPYGGRHDLELKLLRHVSDAFIEDPVRILRIARFAARFHHLGFTVAPETMTLMKAMVTAGEVNALVAERVWKETEKAFEEQHPEIYIDILRQCGALAILFPELNSISDRSARDVALQKACALTQNAAIRFAVCAHGIRFTSPTIPPHWHTLLSLQIDHQNALSHIEALDAQALLDLLNHLDAFRRDVRFQEFLILTTALYGDKAADHLKQAYLIAALLPIAPLTQGLTGIAIKQAIHAARIKVIDEWLKKR